MAERRGAVEQQHACGPWKLRAEAARHGESAAIPAHILVPPQGLEPWTHRLKVCCSNQLSYRGTYQCTGSAHSVFARNVAEA